MPRKQNLRYTDIFPTVLRNLIKKTGTTQTELAAYCNIKQQTISQYKYGETEPTAGVLLKIACFFGVSTDYLLTGISSWNEESFEKYGLCDDALAKLETVKGTDVGRKINELLSSDEFYVLMKV